VAHPHSASNPPLLDLLGGIGDSGCLNDAVEVGVGVEEVDSVDEVEGVAEVEEISVKVNDEDEVLVLVFAGGLRDVVFGCRVVLVLSRHLLLILLLNLSNSCERIVQILHASSIIRPTNTDATTKILFLPPISYRSRFFHSRINKPTSRLDSVEFSYHTLQSSSLQVRVAYRGVVFGDG
jgi:hypothetical protein